MEIELFEMLADHTMFKTQLGRDVPDGGLYVVKTFKKKEYLSANEIKVKLALYRKLSLDFIVPIIRYDSKRTENNIVVPTIVTKCFMKGSLYDLLLESSPGYVSNARKMIFLYGIACGIHNMHINNVLHLNLHPKNILLNETDCPYIDDVFLCGMTNIQKENIDFNLYAAPELMNGSKPDSTCDVYSYGVISYSILTGNLFLSSKTKEKSIESLLTWDPIKIKTFIPRKFQEIITRCCDKDPSKRPTMSEIVKFYESPNYLDSIDFNLFSRYVVSLSPISEFIADPGDYECVIDQLNEESKYFRSFHCSYVYENLTHCPYSLYLLGSCYFKGNGVPRNINEGIRILKGAADLKQIDAAKMLFKYYEDIVKKDKKKSREVDLTLKYCKLVADTDDIEYDYKMGELLLNNGHPKDAAKYFLKGAEQKSTDCEFMIGQLYQKGLGIEENEEKAFKYLKEASDKGHIGALVSIGEIYVSSKHYKNRNLAFTCFSRAVEKGDVRGKCRLAQCFANGWGVEVNKRAAFQLFKESADQGNPDAMVEIGSRFMNGDGVPVNIPVALDYFKKAADKGSPPGLFNLGLAYQKGNGIQQNLPLAFDLMKKSADSGFAPADFLLGLMYGDGIGTNKDGKKSFEHYKKAADNGIVDSQYIVGFSLCNGQNTTKDVESGIKYYKMAVANKHAQSAFNLAHLYTIGKDVPVDHEKAFHYLKIAAEGKIPNAQYTLGLHYEKGIGTAINLDLAEHYYQLAMDGGDQAAPIALANLRRNRYGA